MTHNSCALMLMKAIATTTLVLLTGQNIVDSQSNSPNIIFILLDDLGHADAGFTQSEEFHSDSTIYWRTPFIDDLVDSESIELTRHYVHPTCTPTRAAYITGRYQFRFGIESARVLSELALTSSDDLGFTQLNIGNTLLPQMLKKYGNYNTLHYGKWHLGRAKWEDIFAGYYDQFIGNTFSQPNYYTHRVCFDFARDAWIDAPVSADAELIAQLQNEYPYPPGVCFYDVWDGINSPSQDISSYQNDIYVEDIYYDSIVNFIQNFTRRQVKSLIFHFYVCLLF